MNVRVSLSVGLCALVLGACTGVIPNPPQTNVVQTADGKAQAIVSGCPNWEAPQGASWTNAPSPNLGCATAQNLAAMLADPTDLTEGKKPGPTPADRLVFRQLEWSVGGEAAIPEGAQDSATRE